MSVGERDKADGVVCVAIVLFDGRAALFFVRDSAGDMRTISGSPVHQKTLPCGVLYMMVLQEFRRGL